MPKKIPSIREAQRGYVSGTSAKARVWESRASGASKAWEEGAKSAEAEENYAKGVSQAARQQTRLRGLEPVTSRDFAGAVRGKADQYRRGTRAKSGKWAGKFKPYLDEIKRVRPTIGRKVPGDVRGNIERRVVPIATALHERKVGAGRGAAPAPAPAPGAGRSPAPRSPRSPGGASPSPSPSPRAGVGRKRRY